MTVQQDQSGHQASSGDADHRHWLKRVDYKGWIGLLVAIVAVYFTWLGLRGDSKCPTLDLPSSMQRGGVYTVGTADHFDPGETVRLVIMPGEAPLLRHDNPAELIVRDSGSFSGSGFQVPRDAPVGSVRITAKRQQEGDCAEPSVGVVIT